MYALEPVLLTSSLKQKSLCPSQASTSFTCITNSRILHWRINGKSIFFNCSSELGELKRRQTHVATLLRNSSNECVSVLNVYNSSDMARVGCNNGSEFTTVSVEYYNQVAGMCTSTYRILQVGCPLQNRNGTILLLLIS
jgi:hypothetical protein